MTKQQAKESAAVMLEFCPHCGSGNDSVLKDTTWSCGVRFNDRLWRTKECYKRQIHVGDEHLRLQEQHISELEEENGRLKQRIKRLEEALKCLTLVVGLTPIAGNKNALQEAMDIAIAELQAKEAKP